jgi:hypothetical protein
MGLEAIPMTIFTLALAALGLVVVRRLFAAYDLMLDQQASSERVEQ